MLTLNRLRSLEAKLDTVLFRAKEDDPANEGSVGSTAAKIAGGAYGAGVVTRGVAPLVADRQAGLRAALPGFKQKSPLAQKIAAAGSVLKDKPLAVVSGVAKTVGRDLRKAGTAAAVIGRESVGGLADSFRGAGMIARDVSTPVLARLKGLAGKFVRKP